MNDIAFLDATAQADLVRRKQIKPIELVDAAIERIERINPQINAVITPMYDQARQLASNPIPDAPFTGVPFLMKDLGPMYAGARMTMSTALLSEFIDDHADCADTDDIVTDHDRFSDRRKRFRPVQRGRVTGAPNELTNNQVLTRVVRM